VGGTCSTHETDENMYTKILVGKPEGIT